MTTHPPLTPYFLAEMFADTDTVALAKTNIRRLTRERNTIMRIPLYVDMNYRWVKQQMAEIEAGKIQERINFWNRYLQACEIVMMPEEERKEREKRGVNDFQIQRARERKIHEVAEMLGMKIVRDRVLCPFHNDSNESLYLSKKTNHAICFACDAKKDGIALLMDLQKMSFKEAVMRLQ